MDGPSRLTEWGLETCLPFWLENGWDSAHGGFFECLDLSGRGITAAERQARSSMVGFAADLELAREGYDLLRARAFEQGGMPGWAHALDARGAVIDERRDLYDHAFILLAQASLFKATSDRRYHTDAQQLLAFLDERMKASGPGYVEAIGGAMLALHEAAPDSDTGERLDALAGLARTVFIDDEAGVLREFFSADWSAYPGPAGDTVEPGHLCEWVWLLSEYERLGGAGSEAIRDRLYNTARQYGVVADTGLLCAAMDSTGAHSDARSRSWMQTERIRAAAVQTRLGKPGAQADLDAACQALFQHHLTPAVPGGWIDQVDARGKALSGNIPASTLYHVLGAILETAGTEQPPALSPESVQTR